MTTRATRYVAADGTAYDLSGLSPALMWGLALAGWSLDVDDDTGAAATEPSSYRCVAAFADLAAYDDFAARTYDEATANEDGTLYVDGWGLSCKVGAGEVVAAHGGMLAVRLTFHAQDPTWRRSQTHHLVPAADDGAVTREGLDLPTDAPFDLAGTSVARAAATFPVTGPFAVRATFFGPCTDPYVQVTVARGDGTSVSNRYGVRGSCLADERIVIDPLGVRTVGGSVYRVGAYGGRTNLFGSRLSGTEGSGTYVFQRLGAGQATVTWPQGYAVDVETIEERGVLPWST